jgi:hypothetical protein
MHIFPAGFRPVRIGNPEAKWETNITTNIGFEAAQNNKVSIVFDWYTTNQDRFNPEPGTLCMLMHHTSTLLHVEQRN